MFFDNSLLNPDRHLVNTDHCARRKDQQPASSRTSGEYVLPESPQCAARLGMALL
jgi:hypothetical protein